MTRPQKPKEVGMIAADTKAIFEDLFLYDKYIKTEDMAKRHHMTPPEIRKIYNDYCDNKDMKEEKDRIKRIRGLYDNKKSKKDGSWDFANFKSFYYWYIKQYNEQEGTCKYCKTPEKNIAIIAHEIKATGFEYRGKHLEIERQDSAIGNNKYNEKNCVLCCIFCNNAKSTLFKQDDFKPIADGIGVAIRNIIKNNKFSNK